MEDEIRSAVPVESRNQPADKKPYAKPELVVHGAISEMTEQIVSPGGSTIIIRSDRALKENFTAVDSRAILDSVARLRLESWNYKEDDASVRHMGPMAQDFAKAFGLGTSDKTIHTVDANGVALAAIQALHQIVREQDDRIAALEAEVRQLNEAVVAV